MMKKSYFLLTFLSGALAAQTNGSLEGMWKSDRHGIYISIENTSDGIRTKRTDQDEWYYYEKTGYGIYEDYAGNTVHAVDDRNINWESNDGNHKIRFTRPGSYESDVRSGYQIYGDRREGDPDQGDHYYRYESVSPYHLEGRWRNHFTGQIIRVRERRGGIEVRQNYRSQWIYFDQMRNGLFVDRQGNRYSFHSGTLTFESDRGDFIMRFSRS